MTMKRNIFTMIMAAMASLFALTSCEKEPTELIVGTWKVVSMSMSYEGTTMDMDPAEMGVDYTMTFKADGTMTIMVSAEEGEPQTANGTYSVASNGDTMTLTMTAEGESNTSTIARLDDTTLVIDQDIVEDGMTVSTRMTLTRM